ncbi:peptidase E [Pseudonocardia xinjiangensis]|uniref:Peptidase E n=1 Tax=Pseudonocardia xinjiangensis TaxID=75289 RepID=A0ABX1RLQ8_9PSEU|nr:peptidase E [Pseudonocardia xinjiangensis]NMH80141.1 peptidase E [Pseudonocardia xinjiangensis]
MTADAPTILATSIDFAPRNRNEIDCEPGPIFPYAFELARPSARPRLCFVSTASGDAITYLTTFYGAFAAHDVQTSHLALFGMPNVEDVRAHLLAQDVIWVGGGSTANLLAVWQVHGLDRILRECWEAGVVLGGVSAGSICWHDGGTTDSFGPQLAPITGGLGFLPYSNGVHYDAEERRRPLFHELIGNGTLGAGFATDNGVGIHYRGTEFVEAVADRPDAFAYRVERGADGTVSETRIVPRRL